MASHAASHLCKLLCIIGHPRWCTRYHTERDLWNVRGETPAEDGQEHHASEEGVIVQLAEEQAATRLKVDTTTLQTMKKSHTTIPQSTLTSQHRRPKTLCNLLHNASDTTNSTCHNNSSANSNNNGKRQTLLVRDLSYKRKLHLDHSHTASNAPDIFRTRAPSV